MLNNIFYFLVFVKVFIKKILKYTNYSHKQGYTKDFHAKKRTAEAPLFFCQNDFHKISINTPQQPPALSNYHAYPAIIPSFH